MNTLRYDDMHSIIPSDLLELFNQKYVFVDQKEFHNSVPLAAQLNFELLTKTWKNCSLFSVFCCADCD